MGHWSELVFSVLLSAFIIFIRKRHEKRVFPSFAAAENARNPLRYRQFEVLDSSSKAIADVLSMHLQILTGRQIQVSPDQLTLTHKFSRAWWYGWHYFLSSMFAYLFLLQEPWFWDSSLWWYNYPDQVVSDACWVYYMMRMAFSWSIVLSEKKYSPTFLSHLCIVVHMSISWLHGFYRITTALMVVQDFSNLLKEVTVLVTFYNDRNLYKVFLTVYIVIWIFTHIVFFQYWVLTSAYIGTRNIPKIYNHIYTPLLVTMAAVRYYTLYLFVKSYLQ